MARIQWIDKKLQEWAEWQCSRGGGGSGGAMFDPNRVSQTADVRAGLRNADHKFNQSLLDIDRALCALPNDLKKTVIANYTWEGGKDVIATKLGVTRATLHTRLCNADRRIEEWIEGRERRQRDLCSNLNYASYT